MGAEPLKLACHKITGDYSLGLAVDDDEVKHLVTGITLDCPGGNLTVQSGIGAEKELLSGLSAGIESTADLDSSERTVGEVTAILTGEGNTLGHTLVDDGRADFGETIDISLAAAVVSSFYCVIEKTIDSVVVVLVILGGVDSSLGGDGMGPSGRVADAENLDIIAQLTEGSGRGGSSQSGADYYYLKFSPVVGID